MNPMLRMLLFPFFDQIVDVGIEKWGVMTAVLGLVAYGTWGSPIIPFLDIAALVLTINVAIFGLGIAIYWDYYGRAKHAEQNILDLAKQNKGREQ